MKGIVIQRHPDGTALVQLSAEQGCALNACAAKDDCHEGSEANPLQMFAFLDRSAPPRLRAQNPVGAKPGQRCQLGWQREKERVIGAFWLFLAPATLFLVGMGVGSWLGRRYGLTDDLQLGLSLLNGLVLMGIGIVLAKPLALPKGRVYLVIHEVITPTAEGKKRWLQRVRSSSPSG